MLSKYFHIKTATKTFKSYVHSLLDELSGKKVLIYGAGQGFKQLNKEYNFTKNLNVIAIADVKFNNNIKSFEGIRAVRPQYILDEDVDYILVTNESCNGIVEYLVSRFDILPSKIKCIFKELVFNEKAHLTFLAECNFLKYLPRLINKLKNKKVVIYGSGLIFKTIVAYFDISDLNIIALTDVKYNDNISIDPDFPQYKVCSINEIASLKPDYVVVAVKDYIDIVLNLHFDILKNTNIKVIPFARKSLLEILRTTLFEF